MMSAQHVVEQIGGGRCVNGSGGSARAQYASFDPRPFVDPCRIRVLLERGTVIFNTQQNTDSDMDAPD